MRMLSVTETAFVTGARALGNTAFAAESGIAHRLEYSGASALADDAGVYRHTASAPHAGGSTAAGTLVLPVVGGGADGGGGGGGGGNGPGGGGGVPGPGDGSGPGHGGPCHGNRCVVFGG